MLLLVDLRDGRGDAHHAVLVDQEEEGLRGVELQPAPGREWVYRGSGLVTTIIRAHCGKMKTSSYLESPGSPSLLQSIWCLRI